jgi:hypothetical protein
MRSGCGASIATLLNNFVAYLNFDDFRRVPIATLERHEIVSPVETDPPLRQSVFSTCLILDPPVVLRRPHCPRHILPVRPGGRRTLHTALSRAHSVVIVIDAYVYDVDVATLEVLRGLLLIVYHGLHRFLSRLGIRCCFQKGVRLQDLVAQVELLLEHLVLGFCGWRCRHRLLLCWRQRLTMLR